MRDRYTRYPRNDRMLHGRIQMVRRAMRELDQVCGLFYADERIEARQIGKLIADAVSFLTEARELLMEEARLRYEAAEPRQEALFDEPQPRRSPLSRPCGGCGHSTIDHTEGLRCIACGCQTFTVVDPDQTGEGFCAVEHEGPCEHPEPHGGDR